MRIVWIYIVKIFKLGRIFSLIWLTTFDVIRKKNLSTIIVGAVFGPKRKKPRPFVTTLSGPYTNFFAEQEGPTGR